MTAGVTIFCHCDVQDMFKWNQKQQKISSACITGIYFVESDMNLEEMTFYYFLLFLHCYNLVGSSMGWTLQVQDEIDAYGTKPSLYCWSIH